MKNRLGLVLVHGAGLGGYIWNDLKPLIEHPTLAIEFPNRDSDDHTNKALSFDAYLKTIVKQIEQENSEEIIIVAHSIGGCLGVKLTDYFAEKVAGFIGISAAIPKSGNSFISCLPFPQKALMPIILGLLGTKPPQKSIELELCNDLSDEQTAKVVKRFTPEAKAIYTTKLTYKPLTQRSLYIKLTNDQSFSSRVQDRMIKNLNAQGVIELESGHLPMLSNPKLLAEIINDFVNNQ